MRIEQALSILKNIKSDKYSGFEKNKALSEVILLEAWRNLDWFNLVDIIEWMYIKGDKMEDKAAIVKALLPVLQMTRNQAYLVSLEYSRVDNMEVVTAKWEGGAVKSGDVTGDSGTALIRDVMRMFD